MPRISSLSDMVFAGCAVILTGAFVYRIVAGSTPSDADWRKVPTGVWNEARTSDRAIGPVDARYQMVIFSDYECPACRAFDKEMTTVRTQLGDSLRIIYRHAPIEALHPAARVAAVAADCAMSQAQFPGMNHALYTVPLDSPQLPSDSLLQLVHLPDPARWLACVRDSSTIGQVNADQALGQKLPLRATPTILIARRLHEGGTSATEIIDHLHAGR